MTGLFPGDTYTFEVKAVSGTEISAEKTTTAVICKLQQCLYITATGLLSGDKKSNSRSVNKNMM